MNADTVAVVLAGGEGRRMGGAKALQRFGGVTLIRRAVDLAHAYGSQVAVAIRDASQVTGIGDTPLLLDPPDVGGPIAGLASALHYAQRRSAAFVLTLPCDTPLLPPDLQRRLTAALAPERGVAVAESNGRLHPTCALWRAETVVRLTAYLATGRSSLIGFAEACGLVEVDWPIDEADPFANANTPQDLARLQLALSLAH